MVFGFMCVCENHWLLIVCVIVPSAFCVSVVIAIHDGASSGGGFTVVGGASGFG